MRQTNQSSSRPTYSYNRLAESIPPDVGVNVDGLSEVSIYGTDPDRAARIQQANNFLNFVYKHHLGRYGQLRRAAQLLAVPRISTGAGTAKVSLSYRGLVRVTFDLEMVESFMPNMYVDCSYVIMHEALHWLFDHFSRKGKRNDYIWNIAGDLLINTCLLSVLDRERKNSVLPPTRNRVLPGITRAVLNRWIVGLNLPATFTNSGLTTEDVYDKIYETLQKQIGSDDITKISGLASSIMDSIDPHWRRYWEDAQDANDSQARTKLKELRERALSGLEGCIVGDGFAPGSGAGNIPLGELAAVFPAARQHDEKWQQAIRRMLSSLPADKTELVRTRKRQKKIVATMRQHGQYAGSPPIENMASSNGPLVLVYVDTSGSMSDEVIARVAAFIERQMRMADASYVVFSFDTQVYFSGLSIGDTMKHRKLSLKGRGGTDLSIVAEHAATYQWRGRRADGVIALTDGYWSADFQIDRPKSRYWTILLTPPNYTLETTRELQTNNPGLSSSVLPLGEGGSD